MDRPGGVVGFVSHGIWAVGVFHRRVSALEAPVTEDISTFVRDSGMGRDADGTVKRDFVKLFKGMETLPVAAFGISVNDEVFLVEAGGVEEGEDSGANSDKGPVA